MRKENVELLECWGKIDVLKRKLRTVEERLEKSTSNMNVVWFVVAGSVFGFVVGIVVAAWGR